MRQFRWFANSWLAAEGIGEQPAQADFVEAQACGGAGAKCVMNFHRRRLDDHGLHGRMIGLFLCRTDEDAARQRASSTSIRPAQSWSTLLLER